MKKRSLWLVVSCLMVAVLVMTSCGPAVTEEEEAVPRVEEEEMIGEEEVAVVEEEGAPAPETVAYPDANLEAAIRRAINKPQGPLYISDLAGLEYCVDLQVLYLMGNNISDISPLAGLISLQLLSLSSSNISDISPLANLTNLTELSLGENNLDLSEGSEALENIRQLEERGSTGSLLDGGGVVVRQV